MDKFTLSVTPVTYVSRFTISNPYSTVHLYPQVIFHSRALPLFHMFPVSKYVYMSK